MSEVPEDFDLFLKTLTFEELASTAKNLAQNKEDRSFYLKARAEIEKRWKLADDIRKDT